MVAFINQLDEMKECLTNLCAAAYIEYKEWDIDEMTEEQFVEVRTKGEIYADIKIDEILRSLEDFADTKFDYGIMENENDDDEGGKER